MIDALFTPLAWSEALHFPPSSNRLLLRMATAIERFGASVPVGVAGVIVVEARKEVMAPVGGGLKVQPAALQPAGSTHPAGVRRR